MAKIAIVSGNEHFRVGGVETFVRQLITTFQKNQIDFDEVVYNPRKNRAKQLTVSSPIHNGKIIEISGVDGNTPFKPIKTLEKWIKEGKYDLIIMNSALWCVSKKLLNSEKVIYVQHGQYDQNSWRAKSVGDRARMFFNWVIGIGILGNPYGDARNTVYFCEETDKSKNLDQNKFFSLLPTSFVSEPSLNQSRTGTIWIGRMAWNIKGLDYLEYINEKIDSLEVFGSGDPEKAKEAFGNAYKGSLQHNDVQKELNKKRVFALTSREEGMCFTAIEAISAGCAVVMFETFDAVDFFKKCPSVFTYKVDDIESYIEKIREIESMSADDFSLLEKSSIDFAKKNFLVSDFEKRWIKIVESFMKRK